MFSKLIIEPIYKDIYKHRIFDSVDISLNRSKSAIGKIKKHYSENGFAIFDTGNDLVTPEYLERFSFDLGLEKPIVPGVYANIDSFSTEKGFNRITNKKIDRLEHKAFRTTSSQNLHVDGTLEQIGLIKTTLLFCLNQGISGGENNIFNSVGAFYNFLISDFERAKLFFENKTLRRYSHLNNLEYIGPAFKIVNNKIISRFSFDNTSDWNYGFKNIDGLKDSYLYFMENYVYNDSYHTTIKLNPGQGIIMANDKIAHGRNEFIDSESTQREMIRGLFNEPI